MIKAYDFLMQYKDRFPQIADFDGFNTSFSEAMLLEHMPAMVLEMINHYQYIPELVLVNVGASDFTRFTSSQQHANIGKMTIMCKALTKQVVRPTDTFHGFFFNLMILLPWYVGWKIQRATRHVRSQFNGCLASMGHDHGSYIICHDGICATIGEGLFDTTHAGNLSNVLLIKCVHKLFQVTQEAKVIPFCMSQAIKLCYMDAAVQSLYLDK